MFQVVISDSTFGDHSPERSALAELAEVTVYQKYPGPERFAELAGEADAILSQMGRLNESTLQSLRRCRVIVRYGVGVDNVDVDAATRCGIPVCNVPHYCTDEVADHTLMLVLALVRRLPRSIRYLQDGGWPHLPLRPIRRLSALTLGLFGFGRIAQAVAQRAAGFGFQLAAHDPFVSDDLFHRHGVRRVTREELLSGSDVLSLHMPLQDSTRHLFGSPEIALSRTGLLVVNTARGGLIDTEALLAGLRSGQLGGAALDVLDTEPIPPDHPLWSCENVFMTPHLAWYSEEALTSLQRLVGEECARVLRGEEPHHVVNPAYREYLR